ncbi:hypothetical protein FAM6012_02829 [Lacticaseibacillus paracasei]|uniref:Uncharacterized protein n=1 Tax=Lacticaseibacillus paracasei TaxID=1597 RepID=A0A8B3GMJ3_LACPA|nr:hypothetical protein FAM6012_02829 [Lacticaseibacillus paracasei]
MHLVDITNSCTSCVAEYGNYPALIKLNIEMLIINIPNIIRALR